MEEKKCTGKCGLMKTIDKFNMKNSFTGARQTRCKECLKPIYAEYNRKRRLGIRTIKKEPTYEGE